MRRYDPLGQRGAFLQEEVVRCVERLRSANKGNRGEK